ncbi:MAG TPA: PH domain-containing protein [Anaerolineaceae bacterium]|nr:PH domain-containing protein [Anaerolineaceae bacterium]
MSESSASFQPLRRPAIFLLIGAAGALLVAGGGCLWFAFNQSLGWQMTLLLLGGLALVSPVPLIVYRVYALLNSNYILERDGLRLRWGLRAEDIPLPEVEWVRPANELGYDLPLPPLAWPGAILGVREVAELGPVEFMAADKTNLLLLATPRKIYAISPADPAGFMRAFRDSIELGSLTPLEAHSTRPVAYLQSVWQDRLARILILGGLGSMLLLFIWVGLMTPGQSSITLGYTPMGTVPESLPAERLLLLPVLAALTWAGDLVVGLFFYRRMDQRPAAYLLWGGAIIVALLLLAASL